MRGDSVSGKYVQNRVRLRDMRILNQISVL